MKRSELMNKSPVLYTVTERVIDIMFSFKSVREFANEIGVMHSTAMAWLEGDSQPTAKTAYHICCCLHISFDWLVGLSDTKRRAGLNYTESGIPREIFLERLQMLIDESGGIPELSMNMGIGKRAIYWWLKGKSLPTLETINLICKSANVTANWLFGLTDDLGREMVFPNKEDEPDERVDDLP